MRLTLPTSAIATFTTVLSLDPSNTEALANLSAAQMLSGSLLSDEANRQFRTGDLTGALSTYGQISHVTCGLECSFQVHNNVGALHMQRGDPESAHASFELALKLKPLAVDTVHNLGTALKSLHRYKEALDAFRLCTAAQPDFYSALCGEVEVVTSMGMHDEAVKAATTAIAAKPEDFRAYADRGFAHLKLRQVDEAIADFAAAMDRGSKGGSSDLMKVYALAVSLKGDTQLAAGSYLDAAKTYDKALSMGDPDHPPAGVLFNHALALLHSGDKDAAMDGMTHCVQVEPTFFSAWAAMGLTHLQDGVYPKAVECLSKAFELKQGEFEVGYHLGVAHLKQGHLEDAVSQFRVVLKVKPDHEPSAKALALVEASLAYSNRRGSAMNFTLPPAPTPERVRLDENTIREAEERKKVDGARKEEERIREEEAAMRAREAQARKEVQAEEERKAIQKAEEALKYAKAEEEIVVAQRALEVEKEKAAVIAVEQERIRVEEEIRVVHAEQLRIEREKAEDEAREVVVQERAQAARAEVEAAAAAAAAVPTSAEVDALTKQFEALGGSGEEGALKGIEQRKNTVTMADLEASEDSSNAEVFVAMEFKMTELKWPGPYPKGIRMDKREQYLPDDFFKKTFGLTKTQFYELKKWRQVAKKKEIGLW